MVAIALFSVLSSKFLQVGPWFFFPSFARFPSFIILLNWFCSHIHRYWSAHRHYASCCILAMNIFQVSQVANTFGIVFSVSSLVLYLLYSHVSLCLSKFSLWRKKKKKKGQTFLIQLPELTGPQHHVSASAD